MSLFWLKKYLKIFEKTFSKMWLGRNCVLGLTLLKVCVLHLNQDSPNISWKGPDGKKLLLYRSFSFCCTYSTSPSRLKNSYGQHENTWSWLCFHKTLFTKISTGYSLLTSDLYNTRKIKSNKIFSFSLKQILSILRLYDFLTINKLYSYII